MSRSILLLAVLALSTVAPLAAAHLSHGGCSSTTLTTGAVHVDRYNPFCSGVTVSSSLLSCDGGFDIHVTTIAHVLILYQGGCQTGVVLQVVRPDGTTGDVLA